MATEETRKRIAAAIQAEHDGEREVEGGVLVGFVVVAEWMAPDGEPWLTLVDGDGLGTKGLPRWRTQGYIHNVLHDPGWGPCEHVDGDADGD